jgi:hypothetical protein
VSHELEKARLALQRGTLSEEQARWLIDEVKRLRVATTEQDACLAFERVEVAQCRAHVAQMRAELNAVDRALGNTPTVVWDNSPTRAESIRELGKEVGRLRSLLREVAGSGVEIPSGPPGVTFYTVQIDDDLWERLRKEFGQ